MSEQNNTALIAAADQAMAPASKGLDDFVANARKHLDDGVDRITVIAILYRAQIVTTEVFPTAVDEIMRGLALAAVRLAEQQKAGA